MRKLLLLILLFISGSYFCQEISDTVGTSGTEFSRENSIRNDWEIINTPFRFSPSDFLYLPTNNSKPLYSLYTDSQIKSGLDFGLSPNELLNQFKLANSWETQKKYGIFAKYLGIAEFMGAVGLAAIHISKFHKPPKGKTNMDKNKFFTPKEKENFKLRQLTE